MFQIGLKRSTTNYRYVLYLYIKKTHQAQVFTKAVVEFPGSKSVGNKPFVAPTNLAERLREVFWDPGEEGKKVSDEGPKEFPWIGKIGEPKNPKHYREDFRGNGITTLPP